MTQVQQLYSIDNKVILITGGTGILGWTYCQAVSEAGAKVVVADLPERRPQERALELVDRFGGEALGIVCDVTREEQVRSLVQAALDRFGKVDVTINNAAGTGEFLAGHGDVFASFEEYPLPVWEIVLKTNLTGVFLVAREIGKAMKAAGGGSIINVSSIYGVVGPDHRIYEEMPFGSFPGYSASKAGVLGLTRWLASYWAKDDIRVNAVTPGGVENNHDQVFVSRYSARTPMGRMADRNELIGIMVFLASDASSYCTGQNFIVDGGWTAW